MSDFPITRRTISTMTENSISISDFTILGFFDGKFNPEDIATINEQDLSLIHI